MRFVLGRVVGKRRAEFMEFGKHGVLTSTEMGSYQTLGEKGSTGLL